MIESMTLVELENEYKPAVQRIITHLQSHPDLSDDDIREDICKLINMGRELNETLNNRVPEITQRDEEIAILRETINRRDRQINQLQETVRKFYSNAGIPLGADIDPEPVPQAIVGGRKSWDEINSLMKNM
jgi:predicted RNase H-like nuclease (RuvC/YqgF family)